METYPMAQSYYYDQRQYPDMSYYAMPHHHQHPQQQQHHQQQQQHGLPIMNMHQMATTNAFRGTMNMTSVPATNTSTANPQTTTTTASQKPAIIVQQGSLMPLDTRFVSTDYYGFPSTPPLSASGSSVISSPPASSTQHTFSDSFLSFDKVEGVKEGCEGDVHAEILANPEWSRADSPPMTPVFIHPPSLTASQTSDLLSTNSSCPSLSPSPSPVSSSFDPHTAILSQSSSSSSASASAAAAAAAAAATLSVEPAGATHFCDPRELTVESSLGAADLPPLPTLTEESKLDTPVTLHENVVPEQPVADDALSALPTFDSFSDLDSEDEFVNLVDFPPSQNAFFLGEKRQRVAYPEEDGFLSEPADEVDEHTGFSFEPATVSVPTSVPAAAAAAAAAAATTVAVQAPAAQHTEKEKKRKTLKRSSTVESDCSSHAHHGHGHSHHAHSHAEPRDDARQVSEVSESGAPVSVNRRGRKQSLTDDPSKTFVCTLCSRRFRRQEHLKRHYRSLHTQDKPFECTECGKKFSRSDNLAQHARTHGGQSMMMGVLENSVAYEEDQVSPGAAAGLGAVLYDVEDSASRSNKKRKRDDQ